ncbi:amidohydrolase/deacetylase family metallohydrolase [Planktothrix sp. FACHB-1355]|uniref:Amidohydrolase/deacetylase family metallohydrolase n=1 Tax=Aerosakkonema funiforme FACHB-1375 TaxID=2949571 RepID=A0A926ZF13_9CYAN|nr:MULTISPECIES: amidohydrolase/deacetylase family metallohydrolase [Oscillatoriales]MBD2180653.1 amidohydrolase/deacetylase family metallohydrolase [Aerosakkonema funiforme FACHB-1375]MBD3561047.1 amidohydrolase/deacetylase family metallohydrolase [Planktothrix sp. FACHB-1355]
MDTQLESYDLVLQDAWLIDPSQGLNGHFDIAVSNGKIAAIAERLPAHKAERTVNVKNLITCPGFIDLHTHVYEGITNFGLNADDAGINSGVTTIVDQGSCGSFNFAGFKSNVVDKAQTDVRSFVLVNQGAEQKFGNAGVYIQNPALVDIETLFQLAEKHPHIVRGFKLHGESGSISRWGMGVLKLARELGDETNLPLYVHTGELFHVDEDFRPNPEHVIEKLLSYMKAGDLLAHCYSCKPDGVMGRHNKVPDCVREAMQRGVLLDLGHGLNFSLAIADRMMSQGVFPDIISSDVHGDFDTPYNDAVLDYSLCGAISKLMALGLELERAIASVTINPARVLKAEHEIGTLRIGAIANISILELVEGDWLFGDRLGKQLLAKQRLLPVWVVRAGELIKPNRRLLRDLN